MATECRAYNLTRHRYVAQNAGDLRPACFRINIAPERETIPQPALQSARR
jgi:hypothetical protein